MFNCTPSWNWKEVHIMIISRVILKGTLKVNFRMISSLMKSQSNLGKLAIKYKIDFRIFLFFVVYCRVHRDVLVGNDPFLIKNIQNRKRSITQPKRMTSWLNKTFVKADDLFLLFLQKKVIVHYRHGLILTPL